MTIEATLERIAAALESMARSANTPAAEPPQTPPGPTTPPVPETPPENVAPRPRGRPRKTAEPVQAAPLASTEPEADEPEEQGCLDFLDDAVEAAASEPAAAVAKEYTIEEVRKALGELQTRVGTTRALALFKEVSGGAERLPQLAPEKFAAVFEAAEKMRK
jgi:hypothetical protein